MPSDERPSLSGSLLPLIDEVRVFFLGSRLQGNRQQDLGCLKKQIKRQLLFLCRAIVIQFAPLLRTRNQILDQQRKHFGMTMLLGIIRCYSQRASPRDFFETIT